MLRSESPWDPKGSDPRSWWTLKNYLIDGAIWPQGTILTGQNPLERMKEMRHVVQVGIVVRDIGKASGLWAKLLGMDVPTPVETEKSDVTNMTYRGKLSHGRAKLAFFTLEGISVELIEPMGGPSTWKDFLDRHGEGIHHIAFNVEDMGRSVERLKGIDIGIEQKGDFTGGCYAYTDPSSKLGVILELLAKR